MEKNKFPTNPITCGRVNLDSKFASRLLPNKKPIGRHNSNNRAYLPPLRRALYGACRLWTHFIAEEPWVLETESAYHGMRVDKRIRFEYAACGWGKFLNSWKKKLRIQKYPDTWGRGLNFDWGHISNTSNSQRGIWKQGQTQSFVFNILGDSL